MLDVPPEPYHHNFPKCQFGQNNISNCSFQSLWFTKWKWIHYDAAGDLAYCHVCITEIKSGKLRLPARHAGESAFIYGDGGFSNWNDATRCFNKHEASAMHKREWMLW